VSIELHIERLVIEESLLEGERVVAVRQSFERELTQWLAQPGAIDRLRRIGAVTMLPATTLQAATRPGQRVGGRIAAAVGYGLGIDAQVGKSGRDAQGGGTRG